ITIKGVPSLKATQHKVIADRIEAATFLMAGAVTGGSVAVKDCPVEFLEAPLQLLKETGCKIDITDRQIALTAPKRLISRNLTTSPFPGFATDLQAQFMTLMTKAEGTSLITETIFENRFQHALELKRLGADITLEGHTATVKGVEKLSGAPLMATDLRASASLVLAGLAAEGTTTVDRAYHIDRGYEHIEEKLALLGAKIERK
ncbi:MAG: UDP-N-acetylglucosamine 1-carboxyvinyltransferase, partial [Deltaproteobacteria bacterium]|nr:UDP-N-acetylglucosamine 1-carboxyvinyltransferase [Deltaproteobacteria bacterium]